MDQDNQSARQRLADLGRSARELTEALAARASRFVSRPGEPTVSVKPPKRSKQQRLWRLVDPQDLGEFPPLEEQDLPG